MDTNRKNTILAGSLYIIGTIAGVLSIVPAIDASDYLLKAAANTNQVLLGALFQFIMTLAYMGFAITLYPILKKYKQNLALGFLSFRIMAAVLNMIAIISILMILSVSREFVKAGTEDTSYYQTLGDLLRSGRDFVNHVVMILTLSAGGLMFYLLLYQTKLIPRWLSLWGLAGTALTITASLLVMFYIIDIITPVYLALNFPLIILEIVLAIWLIARGFDSKVLNSISE